MGYHVIIDPACFPIKYTYVEWAEDLVGVEGINEKSIIFQGNVENPPQQVGVSVDFQKLREEWYRAGMRAQALFARLAGIRGLILEGVSQDPESFKNYFKAIKGPLKRGDFLVRNRGNIEIEVKCRSFYGKSGHQYFLFSEDDLKKHLNMEKASRTPVIIAVFRRKNDQPVENTLCMIKVDRIHELARTAICEDKEYGRVYRIPLSETVPGFDLLPDYVMEEKGDVVDLLEGGYCLYAEPEDAPYVLVAYYKSLEHLEWIIGNGLYNLRLGTDRGAVCLGKEEAAARYILLHTRGEIRTGKLFRILESGPRVYTKELLMRKKYPGIPAHDFYLVYRVTPALDKEFEEQIWDISQFPGYETGRKAAFPFAVPLAELLK